MKLNRLLRMTNHSLYSLLFAVLALVVGTVFFASRSPDALPLPKEKIILHEGEKIIVNRLLVRFAPSVTRAEAEVIIESVRGITISFLPRSNTYIIAIPSDSVGELEKIREVFDRNPRVEGAFEPTLSTPD